MKFRGVVQVVMFALIFGLLSGCGAMIQVAMVGAGKSATTDDTGFLKSYQGLTAPDTANPSLPDFSYVSNAARISSYNRVLMPDFVSINPDVAKLAGLQIRQYKTIRQELPDLISSTFDRTVFNKVSRTSERIEPNDTAAIRKLPADAVLMGNIKELSSSGGSGAGLTSIQIEYKLIDVKTGEEVVTAIHRSTTDLDKIAMGQVRVLTVLLNKAKAMHASAPIESDHSSNATDKSPPNRKVGSSQSVALQKPVIEPISIPSPLNKDSAASPVGGPDWTKLFKSWENGCKDSPELQAFNQHIFKDAKANSKSGTVNLPALYKSATGTPKFEEDESGFEAATLAVTAGTYYGFPVKAIRSFTGDTDGTELILNASVKDVKLALNKKNVAFKRGKGGVQVKVSGDTKETSVGCYYAMGSS